MKHDLCEAGSGGCDGEGKKTKEDRKSAKEKLRTQARHDMRVSSREVV
jgi:hypothetical protein